jgi:hypothetical protein
MNEAPDVNRRSDVCQALATAPEVGWQNPTGGGARLSLWSRNQILQRTEDDPI